MRFEDRAERITGKQIAETFVSVGPLMDLLSSNNNQIMYGRRGTGKTHALRYFQSTRIAAGDIAIYIDGQNLGSNGSIYNDTTIPVSERATRLLIDVCTQLHHELLEVFTAPKSPWDLGEAVKALDGFIDGFTETRIIGAVEREGQDKSSGSSKLTGSIGATIAAAPSSTVSASTEQSTLEETSSRQKQSGLEESWIDFSFFSKTVRSLARFISPKRLWILIDEWTTIPPDIQPYLADLIRRSMFSVPNITVKIAAIEHRSEFKIDRKDEGYIGFELGADISAAINLDDYLVIDNDEDRAKSFFRNFISNHVQSIAEEIGVEVDDINAVIPQAFTQDNVFTEFVRATEGVPRDAMHLLTLASQKAGSEPISMPLVRSSAFAFFQTEKYAAIKSNKANRLLLEWIRDEVISGRKTRAFLLAVGSEDEIIDRLFDRRALHILNRSRSAAHRPGERFVVYKLDYGLYVDLILTDQYPEGLLVSDQAGIDIEFDVPIDDARSYRRAILDLAPFYEKHPELLSDAKV